MECAVLGRRRRRKLVWMQGLFLQGESYRVTRPYHIQSAGGPFPSAEGEVFGRKCVPAL